MNESMPSRIQPIQAARKPVICALVSLVFPDLVRSTAAAVGAPVSVMFLPSRFSCFSCASRWSLQSERLGHSCRKGTQELFGVQVFAAAFKCSATIRHRAEYWTPGCGFEVHFFAPAGGFLQPASSRWRVRQPGLGPMPVCARKRYCRE